MATATVVPAPAHKRRFFADLSVNIKILTAVGVAALVALIVGILGLQALSAASDSAQLMYRSSVASINAISDG